MLQGRRSSLKTQKMCVCEADSVNVNCRENDTYYLFVICWEIVLLRSLGALSVCIGSGRTHFGFSPDLFGLGLTLLVSLLVWEFIFFLHTFTTCRGEVALQVFQSRSKICLNQ